jgi:heme/copper-type cytochrome/quinol oxidase subunit 2
MWPRTDSPERSLAQAYAKANKGVAMHWMDGTDWLWMSFMMVFWLIVFGAVIYAAVRLAQRPPREGKH